MPEGHTVHRLARQFGDVFGGRRLAVSSPQGRFAEGAALLDGHRLEQATAHGKHLFLRFDHALVLHVHLGLYGAWGFGGDESFRGASSIGAPRKVGEREESDGGASVPYAGPPPPVGAVRVRLVSDHGWADLRGATTCAVITEAEAGAVLSRLGPDPLRNLPGDRATFIKAVQAKATPVGALLMDQSVVAGVGNVYRAELLFRGRLDPWLPGRSLPEEAAGPLWDDAVALLSDGVRDGRIITTPPSYWNGSGPLPEQEEAHFVYKRHGQECRICGSVVAMTEMVARKLYWCPTCQQGL